jgi:hypothetical protein
MGHTMLYGFKNLSDSTLLAHPVSTLQVRIADSKLIDPADIFYLFITKKIKRFLFFLFFLQFKKNLNIL